MNNVLLILLAIVTLSILIGCTGINDDVGVQDGAQSMHSNGGSDDMTALNEDTEDSDYINLPADMARDIENDENINAPEMDPANEIDIIIPNDIVADLGNNENVIHPVENTGNREGPNSLIRFNDIQGEIPPPPFDVDIDFVPVCGSIFDEKFSNIMFINPDNYLGKTMRLIGQYYMTFDDFSDQYFHYILVNDEEGCCVHFIEFAWSDGNTPNEFPEKLSIIDVTGVFSTYFEETFGWDLYYLMVDDISTL